MPVPGVAFAGHGQLLLTFDVLQLTVEVLLATQRCTSFSAHLNLWGDGLFHEGVRHSIRGASELEEPAVVHDPVDHCGSHLVISEHVPPPGEFQIRRQNQRALLVGVSDDLEQEPRPFRVDGEVTELVNDEQTELLNGRVFFVEPVGVFRATQLRDECRCGGEPGGEALHAGSMDERACEVSFPGPHVTVEHQISGVFQKFEAGERFSPVSVRETNV